MRISLKVVVCIQLALIFILLGILIYPIYPSPESNSIKNQTPNPIGLLSPRIYAGLIPPQSYLIFNYEPLRQGIRSYIEQNNLNLSVYVVNMRDGASMSINANAGYPPASLSKVPLAILIMKQIEEGNLSLDTKVTISEEDKSASYGDLYQTTQKEFTIRFLLEKMLKDSDNTAFLTLNRYKGTEDFTPILKNYLGYYNNGNAQGHDITPKSMYNIFSSLYLSTILEPKDSEYILSLLTQTSFDIKQIAHLPPDTTISHKFASQYQPHSQYFHDCGIMFIQDMRLFYCVMTSGLDETAAAQNVGLIVNNIYNYTLEERTHLDEYKKVEKE